MVASLVADKVGPDRADGIGRTRTGFAGLLCGTRASDFDAANALAGLKCTPDGYTWHHHEELGRMQLVKSTAHKSDDHAGGVQIWKAAVCRGKPADVAKNKSLCGYDDEFKTSGGSSAQRPPCPKP